MRAFERQEGETNKSFEAFKLYRDLGPRRSLRRCAEAVYGEGTASVRRIEHWSKKHDWVARAQAWDDYHEMLRRDAIAEYERSTGTDLAYRSGKLQEDLLNVKEMLVKKLETMAKWPLQRESVEYEKYEDGRIKKITNVYPAKWGFHTLVKAIEVLDDSPDKIAFTDPTGNHQYGQDPDEVRRLFMEIVEAERKENEEREREE